jgi:asparagine synthase (glutamine-hydrolysing)
MAESVEARAPYLDRRIADIAFNTPKDWCLRNGENKYLLRKVSRQDHLLPAQTSARPKFGAALATDWMDTDPAFRTFARDLILSPGSQTSALGLTKAMKEYFERSRTGYRWPASISIFVDLAWRLLLLELWAKTFLTRQKG